MGIDKSATIPIITNLQRSQENTFHFHTWGDRVNKRIRYNRIEFRYSLLMVEHEDQTQSEYAEHMNGERYQEEKEEPVIAPSDTIIHPRTVVIESLKQKFTRERPVEDILIQRLLTSMQ